MAQVSIEFDLPIPNEYQKDHSYSDGKTRKFTYHGPDKIWLQLGSDGKEKYGPLTAEDIADGRPQPADVTEWKEIDCATDPLICQLRAPIDDSKQEAYKEPPDPHPDSPNVSGYDQLMRWTLADGAPKPDDIYDKLGVTKNTTTGNMEIRKIGVNESIHGDDIDLTWAILRDRRDQQLEGTDGQMASDLPTSMIDEYKGFRQALRDMPSALSAVDPNIAAYMFPTQPANSTKRATAAIE